MAKNLPLVSVIVPCRNEQNFIAKCLDSLVAQNYPKENLEIFVIDGMSGDGTRKTIAGYCQRYGFIKSLDNSKKITPCAFNLGVNNAKGDYIAIMGAHAEYGNNYISKCVAKIQESAADNVGGILSAKPARNTIVAKAIAFALEIRFAAGGLFRGESAMAREVDTVFGGFYRKDVFEKIGLFDERLARSQDMEFNMRLKKAGGKIMLFPDIVVYYYPKSKLGDFLIHNFWDGLWAVYPLKFIKIPLKLRHYVPLIFVSLILVAAAIAIFWHSAMWLLSGIAIFYFSASLFFSAKIAIKEKERRYLFLVPVAFAARHFGYGIGSLYGIVKLAMPQKNGRKN